MPIVARYQRFVVIWLVLLGCFAVFTCIAFGVPNAAILAHKWDVTNGTIVSVDSNNQVMAEVCVG